MMKRHFNSILILGAGSSVAEALAYRYAAEGCSLILAARNVERLDRIARDIRLRNEVDVLLKEFDSLDYDSHQLFVDSLPWIPDIVIVTFGYLGNQELALTDFKEARKIIETNYLGAVSIMNALAQKMKGRNGILVGIASVAGLRGRMSNFTYGSAKAGFLNYLSGLRNWGYHNGIHVVSIIPGFMQTPMIAHMKTPKFLTLSPDRAAHLIFRAIQKKRNIAYIGPIWCWIMFIIRLIPEYIFKKLRL